MKLPQIALFLIFLGCNLSLAQDTLNEPGFAGPTKDVTFRVLWLIESDDENRIAYGGPAREGLTAAGYGRLVPAGSATGMISVGQRECCWIISLRPNVGGRIPAEYHRAR